MNGGLCVIPPPQQQKQSLCLPAWSDREKPLRLWALKDIGPQREVPVQDGFTLNLYFLSGVKSHSHCVLVSHRPPRYPTTSLVVRWQWKSWIGKARNLSVNCSVWIVLVLDVLLTISSSTLLDTATLKGWNLLMAEKAESSTSVCGSLRRQGSFYPTLILSRVHVKVHVFWINTITGKHLWFPRCNIWLEFSLCRFSATPSHLERLTAVVLQLAKTT